MALNLSYGWNGSKEIPRVLIMCAHHQGHHEHSTLARGHYSPLTTENWKRQGISNDTGVNTRVVSPLRFSLSSVR